MTTYTNQHTLNSEGKFHSFLSNILQKKTLNECLLLRHKKPEFAKRRRRRDLQMKTLEKCIEVLMYPKSVQT
jgi:hypothetical protein